MYSHALIKYDCVSFAVKKAPKHCVRWRMNMVYKHLTLIVAQRDWTNISQPAGAAALLCFCSFFLPEKYHYTSFFLNYLLTSKLTHDGEGWWWQRCLDQPESRCLLIHKDDFFRLLVCFFRQYNVNIDGRCRLMVKISTVQIFKAGIGLSFSTMASIV